MYVCNERKIKKAVDNPKLKVLFLLNDVLFKNSSKPHYIEKNN